MLSTTLLSGVASRRAGPPSGWLSARVLSVEPGRTRDEPLPCCSCNAPEGRLESKAALSGAWVGCIAERRCDPRVELEYTTASRASRGTVTHSTLASCAAIGAVSGMAPVQNLPSPGLRQRKSALLNVCPLHCAQTARG